VPTTDLLRPFPRQLILGHRGSPREAVENTLASFAAALSAGADGVELDVRRSRDGEPVVIHDDTLDRTMGVKGCVSRLHWSAVERLSGARVPSLAQAAAWARASGAWLNIELKSAGVEEAVVKLVGEAGIRDRTIVSSFQAESVRRVGEIDPIITRYFLAERWDQKARRMIDRADARGLCLRVDAATPEVLADLRARGVPVIVWTVNDPVVMTDLLHAGVAALITDDPSVAVRLRDELDRS
jgi:glycerophosphoryl diester phosphodiesterase